MTSKMLNHGRVKFAALIERLREAGFDLPNDSYAAVGRLVHTRCEKLNYPAMTTITALEKGLSSAFGKNSTVIGGPTLQHLFHAFNFSPSDQEWFLSGDVGDFRNRLSSHDFNADTKIQAFASSASRSKMKIESQAPVHFLDKDVVSFGLHSVHQGVSSHPGQLALIAESYLSLIRIPKEGIAYGFQSIMWQFDFGECGSLQLIDRADTSRLEATMECGGILSDLRQAHDPLFEVSSEDPKMPLQMRGQTPILGMLENARLGDKFTVRVRAELKSGIIQLYNKDEVPDSDKALAELQKLVFDGKIRRMKCEEDPNRGIEELTLSQYSQFIELVSQELEVVSDAIS